MRHYYLSVSRIYFATGTLRSTDGHANQIIPASTPLVGDVYMSCMRGGDDHLRHHDVNNITASRQRHPQPSVLRFHADVNGWRYRPDSDRT